MYSLVTSSVQYFANCRDPYRRLGQLERSMEPLLELFLQALVPLLLGYHGLRELGFEGHHFAGHHIRLILFSSVLGVGID